MKWAVGIERDLIRQFMQSYSTKIRINFVLTFNEALAQVFSSEFCEIFKNSFSYRTPPVAASVWVLLHLKEGVTYRVALKNRTLKRLLTSAKHLWKNGSFLFFQLDCMKSIQIRIFSGLNTGKYGPDKTPYLDNFYVMLWLGEILIL